MQGPWNTASEITPNNCGETMKTLSMLFLIITLLTGTAFATKIGITLDKQNISEYGFKVDIQQRRTGYAVAIIFPAKNDHHLKIHSAELQMSDEANEGNNFSIPLNIQREKDSELLKIYFFVGTKILKKSSVRLSGLSKEATLIYFINLNDHIKQ